jgi:Ran GTPase-activating protein (RanGAP) involved in mRNA processing and transport
MSKGTPSHSVSQQQAANRMKTKILSNKIHIYPKDVASSSLDSLWWQVDRSTTPKDEQELQLNELEVSSVYISNEVARTMTGLFRRHPIRKIILRMCEVWPDVLEELFQECPSMQELTLHRITQLNHKCMRLITQRSSTLRSLSIHYKPQSNNNSSFAILLRRIHKLQRLESLRLDGSPLSQPEDIQALVKSLETPGALPQLKVLSFKSCLLSDESVARILSVIADDETRLPSLTTLDLSINCCYEKGIEALARLLECPSCHLERLDLSCQLPRVKRPFPVKLLGRALGINQSLKALRLSGNAMQDESFLGDMLTANKGLEVLDWCGNGLQEPGLRRLGRAIAHNCTLKSLNLKSNPFSSLEPLLLDVAMPANDTLCQLSHSCRGPAAQHIAFLCELNTAGRRMVRENPSHLALWPLVMERCHDNVDALYFFVQNAPIIWVKSHS